MLQFQATPRTTPHSSHETAGRYCARTHHSAPAPTCQTNTTPTYAAGRRGIDNQASTNTQPSTVVSHTSTPPGRRHDTHQQQLASRQQPDLIHSTPALHTCRGQRLQYLNHLTSRPLARTSPILNLCNQAPPSKVLPPQGRRRAAAKGSILVEQLRPRVTCRVSLELETATWIHRGRILGIQI